MTIPNLTKGMEAHNLNQNSYQIGMRSQAEGWERIPNVPKTKAYLDSMLRCTSKSRQCGNACIPKAKKCRISSVVEDIENQIINSPYEKGVVINPKNGAIILAKSGDRTSIDFTGKEIAKMKGSIFTHNHPNLGYSPPDKRALGFGFSKADFQVAAVGELAEMRAVSQGYRHSIKPPKTGWDSNFWVKAEPIYQKNYQDVYSETLKNIFSGKQTFDQAEADFHHEVMRKTAKELKFKYSRISMKK
jgi:hypothetical protein